MPSLQLNFDCSTLREMNFPFAVSCTSNSLKVGNDVTWALGTTATVTTFATQLKGRITTIAIDTSVIGPEYDATVAVKLIVNNTAVFSDTKNITSQSVTLAFFVNMDVDGYVKVEIAVSERASVSIWPPSGYVERTYSSPIISYEEIVTPPPIPTPSITVNSVSALRMNSYTDKLYTNEPVSYYSLRVEYTANCKGTGVAKITINGKSAPDVGVVWTDLYGIIVINFSQFSSGTIADLLKMYAPNVSSLVICVDGIAVTGVM